MGDLRLIVSSYELLNEYPDTQIFINKITKRPVRACIWGTKVKLFFNGKKYSNKGNTYGERSMLLSIKAFNNKFCPPEDGMNIPEWFIPSLYEKKRCVICGKEKILHDFRELSRLGGLRADQCKACMKEPPLKKAIISAGRLNYSEYMLELDRSSRSNFIAYMIINPYYFEDTYCMKCTRENIEMAFNELNIYTSPSPSIQI